MAARAFVLKSHPIHPELSLLGFSDPPSPPSKGGVFFWHMCQRAHRLQIQPGEPKSSLGGQNPAWEARIQPGRLESSLGSQNLAQEANPAWEGRIQLGKPKSSLGSLNPVPGGSRGALEGSYPPGSNGPAGSGEALGGPLSPLEAGPGRLFRCPGRLWEALL